MHFERLDKVIASRSSFSRKEARNLIKDGNVRVNGELVSKPDMTVNIACDSISLFEKPFKTERFVYIMMNKPAGVLSASRDANTKTVMDLLPEELFRRGLFPAGRLDKDTTGLLIITDDGDFAHQMLSPRKRVPKTYRARLKSPLKVGDLDRLQEGIELKDGTVCQPARGRDLSCDGEFLAELVITEGKYHQVKRMFAALGNEVLGLNRVAIGTLNLDEKLEPGQSRELNSEEVCKLLGMLVYRLLDYIQFLLTRVPSLSIMSILFLANNKGGNKQMDEKQETKVETKAEPKTKLTQEGYQKLADELEYLKTVGRDEIAERIAVARSFGDLSENAEYNEAMNEQGKMEARIAKLEQDLQNVEIIDGSLLTTRAVSLGSKVKLYDMEFEEELEYTILGKSEANPDEGIISDESPIGKALLGRKKNEVVQVQTPNGSVLEFKILKISK